MKSLTVILLLIIAWPIEPAFATPIGPVKIDSVRLACGASTDIWNYINQSSAKYEKESLPSVSDESSRYYIGYPDGSWLITVEYAVDAPNGNFACIVDKGRMETALESMQKPVASLPTGIIAARVSVPVLQHPRISANPL